jgi:hypothetical protein
MDLESLRQFQEASAKEFKSQLKGLYQWEEKARNDFLCSIFGAEDDEDEDDAWT